MILRQILVKCRHFIQTPPYLNLKLIKDFNMGNNMKPEQLKAVAIFESVGGTDKGPDGHRKDTLPIVESLKAKGWKAEVIKFENDKA